jgi:serine/threonine-protein kinase HipA
MEPKALSTAHVYKGELLIGELRRTALGATFTYFDSVGPESEGVSYTMPPRRRTYEVTGSNLHPFFAGLLPEGLRLKALRTILKTSEDDLFSLLLGSGGDIIGDISVTAPDASPPTIKGEAYELEQVNFHELFQKAIAAQDPAERARDLTIAGIQPKISAGMISFPVQVKMRRRFCILKLSPTEFPRIAENEFFFTEMARACGLDVPRCSLVKDQGGSSGLLLERFDRRFNKTTKKAEKIHQEDACQFLDRYPADKYRLSFREIAEGVASRSSAPIVECAKLLRLKAFSYLITNGDLHAKNISLATDPGTGSIRLTPAYDLVATLPYGDRTMALSFEGRDDNLKARDFIAFGERCGVRAPAMRRILSDLVDKSLPWIERLAEIGLTEKQTIDLRKMMHKRREDLGNLL